MESDILFNIKLIESESPLFPTFRFSLCSDRRGTTQCRPPVSQEVGRPDAVQTGRGGETSGRPEDVDRGRMPPPEPEGEPPKTCDADGAQRQSSAQGRWRCSSPSTSGWWGWYLDMSRLQESHQWLPNRSGPTYKWNLPQGIPPVERRVP